MCISCHHVVVLLLARRCMCNFCELLIVRELVFHSGGMIRELSLSGGLQMYGLID